MKPVINLSSLIDEPMGACLARAAESLIGPAGILREVTDRMAQKGEPAWPKH